MHPIRLTPSPVNRPANSAMFHNGPVKHIDFDLPGETSLRTIRVCFERKHYGTRFTISHFLLNETIVIIDRATLDDHFSSSPFLSRQSGLLNEALAHDPHYSAFFFLSFPPQSTTRRGETAVQHRRIGPRCHHLLLNGFLWKNTHKGILFTETSIIYLHFCSLNIFIWQRGNTRISF